LTSVTVGTANKIEPIFGDAWTAEGSPDFVAGLFSRLRLSGGTLFSTLSHGTGSARDIAGTYSAGFLILVAMRLRLHFGLNVARKPLTLLPPLLPPMDITSSQYDEPDEPDSATFLWPWLRGGLVGTPLARLSSTSGRRWAGHFTYGGSSDMSDPPMIINLYFASPPSANAAANKVYFRGEGAETYAPNSAAPFTLEGAADTENGVVIAAKRYSGGTRWEWHGVITPFGMVGVWGTGTQASGWWWIWPQEWSET
jgi:hypothetical protein